MGVDDGCEGAGGRNSDAHRKAEGNEQGEAGGVGRRDGEEEYMQSEMLTPSSR